MNKLKRSLLIIFLFSSCVGCDHITKDLAQQYLAAAEPISWLHDTVRLEYAENAGAFLSFGMDFPEGLRAMLFQALPAFVLIGVIVFLVSSTGLSTLATVAWCLVLSGGMGNLLDRILHHGRVIDFMNVGIGPVRTGIFNVADVCITTGVAVVVIIAFQQRNQQTIR